MPNSGKMASQRLLLAKNTKAGRPFCSNFLTQSVTKIKNAAHPCQKFSEYPGMEARLKRT